MDLGLKLAHRQAIVRNLYFGIVGAGPQFGRTGDCGYWKRIDEGREGRGIEDGASHRRLRPASLLRQHESCGGHATLLQELPSAWRQLIPPRKQTILHESQ